MGKRSQLPLVLAHFSSQERVLDPCTRLASTPALMVSCESATQGCPPPNPALNKIPPRTVGPPWAGWVPPPQQRAAQQRDEGLQLKLWLTRVQRWMLPAWRDRGTVGMPYLDIPDAHAAVHPRGAELRAVGLPTCQH